MLNIDKRRLKSPTGGSLDSLEKKIYLRLKEYGPYLENQKLLLAVSGGVDSVALLHVMTALASRLKVKLSVVHIDHGVRGSDSAADAQFVEVLSKKLKIPFYVEQLQGLSKQSGEGVLRERRYSVLFGKKKEAGAAFVVTAHHRDDLLETRLMRLLQGTGINGLRAMEIKSEDGLLRPFLEVTRREIEMYAQRKNLSWCLDVTNLDTRRLRNWIRRNWLGVLRQDHPEYVNNLFESLERTVRATAVKSEESKEALERKSILDNSDVYSYLRHFSKHRVTSLHVEEFKKRLRAERKNFTFRLAGVDWQVSDTAVRPLKRP